ncbi:MAG: endonuclease/exonuclease/phosphatase family protein [Clostridia bacterium]|nr:endonuclease/exonuclease/phosphatase family protein [Clostridia bacterium]
MKIMSFNTQHCYSYLGKRVDYDIMAKAILDLDADIVGLNEMFDQGSIFGKQTEKLSELTGLNNSFFAKAISLPNEGAYGNGILSRYKIKSCESIIIPDPDPRIYDGYYETRCVLKAELENGLLVLVTHFGLNPDEQQSAVQTILKHIRQNKCILMGDFNITPDNELLKPIKEKMVDTAILFDSEKKSWPSDEPQIKIDYIFVSPDIEIVSADIPEITSSDHRPYILEIK